MSLEVVADRWVGNLVAQIGQGTLLDQVRLQRLNQQRAGLIERDELKKETKRQHDLIQRELQKLPSTLDSALHGQIDASVIAMIRETTECKIAECLEIIGVPEAHRPAA